MSIIMKKVKKIGSFLVTVLCVCLLLTACGERESQEQKPSAVGGSEPTEEMSEAAETASKIEMSDVTETASKMEMRDVTGTEEPASGIETTDAAEPEEIFDIEEIEFPLLLEDGKLEIKSAFQFDGINPDCNNQEGDNIASIVIENLSDEYLEQAEIRMQTNEGTLLHFVVTEIPAGRTAVAFSVDNAVANSATVYGNVSCEASFSQAASMNEDRILVRINGTAITLENISGETLNEIVVYCRATLGDQYFGGITYSYNINQLSADGTAQIEATECFLGLVEVVRIAINE